MSPEEYCRNKAAPAGSNLYYSSLYHDPQSQRKLHALFAFYHEISEVVCQSSDPGAARVTLYWWFEEIGRLFSGEARHPITLELSQLDSENHPSQPELPGCVAATAQFLDAPQTGTYRDWLERHSAAAGATWKAAGQACGCRDPDILATLTTAGCCYGAFELLHHVRHFARLGLDILPSDLMTGHNLSLETVIRPDHGEAAKGFFNELFELLLKDMETCRVELDGNDAGNLLFARVMLKILVALCREYQSAPGQITDTRISLTPIRKLWIAWRTSRSGVSTHFREN